MEYVADWQALLPEVEARGGTVLAFCSEPPRYARRVRAGRSLSFPVLGDPRNVLAHHLIDEGVVPGLLVAILIAGLHSFDGTRSASAVHLVFKR